MNGARVQSTVAPSHVLFRRMTTSPKELGHMDWGIGSLETYWFSLSSYSAQRVGVGHWSRFLDAGFAHEIEILNRKLLGTNGTDGALQDLAMQLWQGQ